VYRPAVHRLDIGTRQCTARRSCKGSRGLKAIPSELVSVAIHPEIRVVNGKISGSDLALLRRWIELNQDVIVRYWNSEIGTMDALRAIRSI